MVQSIPSKRFHVLLATLLLGAFLAGCAEYVSPGNAGGGGGGSSLTITLPAYSVTSIDIH